MSSEADYATSRRAGARQFGSVWTEPQSVVFYFRVETMISKNGVRIFRARILFLLLIGCPLVGQPQSILIGDIKISPQDFAAVQKPEQRIAKCLACHGDQAGGDIDFGPKV